MLIAPTLLLAVLSRVLKNMGGIAYCPKCGQGWGTIPVLPDGTAPCPYCGTDQHQTGVPMPVLWLRRWRYNLFHPDRQEGDA